MRLGGPILEHLDAPEDWIAAHKRLGYSAAYCPLQNDAADAVVNDYARAAKEAGIVIAEVGAWSNPLGPNNDERKQAVEHCKKQLALAERIGAMCCVNIAGSRGSKWDGPDERDLTDETFAMIVDTVREIIDAVKPTRTFYSLEMMPWMYPDSPDSYLELMSAIDRKELAVHLDPANIINCPRRYFNSGELLRECFRKLGPHIKSCHGKDIILGKEMTTHLSETIPGRGNIDYGVFLQELNKLDPHTALMLEHLTTAEEYAEAANYVRSVAEREDLKFA